MKKTSKKVTLVNDDTITIERGMWFVTMTDKFLSGWGLAQDKTAKRVIICRTLADALTLIDRINAHPNEWMSRVNYTPNFPYYSPSRFVVSYDIFSNGLFNF